MAAPYKSEVEIVLSLRMRLDVSIPTMGSHRTCKDQTLSPTASQLMHVCQIEKFSENYEFSPNLGFPVTVHTTHLQPPPSAVIASNIKIMNNLLSNLKLIR